MYLQTVLVVCCMFAAGECIWCDDLKACLAPYDRFGDPSEPANLAALMQAGNFDNYCTSLADMGSCVNSHKDACWNEDEVLEATVAVQLTDYICDSNNRAGFIALASLENTCLEDPTVEATIDRGFESCLRSFESSVMNIAFEIQFGLKSVSDICPLANTMGTCMDNVIKGVCEPQVSSWFTDLINHAIYINAKQFGCSKVTTKRSLSLIRRSLAMLKKR